MGVLSLVPILFALGLVVAVYVQPFPADLLEPETVESRRLFDRHGRLLREALSDRDGRGVWRKSDAVSPWLHQAFIAIEDRRFYDHGGVDYRGIARALWTNLKAGRVVSGGSTITQQVVKHLQPRPRSLWGKLGEAVGAWRLERLADKEQILEQYLNRAPFGHGAFGVEAASRLYFDKAAMSLSLGEAALIAGIPRAPSLNNPFSDRKRALARQRSVLQQMHDIGLIDERQHEAARAQSLRFAVREDRFSAPHFTTWALSRNPPPGRIPTTLDLDLQTAVENAARRVVRELVEQRVSQAAVVVLENETGDVLAWLGSIDFFDPNAGQVDMVLRLRQPGSTLKPFVYGLALEDGFSANTTLPDFPLYFPTLAGDYRPRNYDRRFHGWVTLRTALANSYNVPVVWLVNRMGAPRLLQRLHAVGLTELTRDADYYGLGLGLGNGEVSLLHLANAYRALARGGRWSPLRWRLDVPVGADRPTMPEPIAHLLTDILSDRGARSASFGRDTVLDTSFPTAAKTGTSTDFTDNWTVGYSSEVTVAVWVGNFGSQPMQGVSGIAGAGPLWSAVMTAAMAERESRAFEREGLSRVRLCRETGAPWTSACSHGLEEWVVPDTPVRVAARQPIRSTRVIFPDAGDIFQRDVDVPAAHGRVRFRAEAPEHVAKVVWELDGRVLATTPRPFEAWWSLIPGHHRLRVWPAGDPAAASPVVRFEVLP